MSDASDVVHDFLVESYENLDQLDRSLVALEQDPSSKETLASIFRTIHTIKGTCGFLGFGKLEQVTHAGENLLSRLRDSELQLNSDMTSGLLALVDAVREILANIETTGAEGDTEYAALIHTLVQLQELGAVANPPRDVPPHESNPPAASPAAAAREREAVSGAGEPSPASSGSDSRSGCVADSSIRVDVGLLDKLMNRVGELVLARNQILQFTSTLGDAGLLSTSQRLNLITMELQEGVMKTRMQPIDNIWSKFPRVVRDLAMQCGKKVRIEMEGKETELDKTIIEAIKDPLTHLVRNSVDHGIETPEQRLAHGKPAEGRLLLRAFHEGGQVNIEISDDGAGLDAERVRQKALQRGLITQDQAQRMSDREVANLIFAPGFSTAGQVTNISGRGVGMDVVKTNVEKIGGTVDIQSHAGQGTTVKLKIPLTLAIIPALVVTCGGDRFAIPQVSLLELVRLEGEQARHGIERLHGAPVYRLRGQLLPIVYLRNELELDGPAVNRPVSNRPEGNTPVSGDAPATADSQLDADSPTNASGPSAADTTPGADVVNIVVLRADDRQFGLVVDSINDTEEIVVKPLSKQLKGIPVYAGATIMGDGKVALILDVLGMAQRAHVVSEIRDRGLGEPAKRASEDASGQETLLVLAVGDRRIALPISMVSRLEELPWSSLENSGQRELVQYRQQIMPLVRLADILGTPSTADPDRPLQVVVHTQGGRSIGLVVDRIVDIVETALDVSRPAAGDCLLASAVIQQRVTDLLNLPAVIGQADPNFFDTQQAEGGVQ